MIDFEVLAAQLALDTITTNATREAEIYGLVDGDHASTIAALTRVLPPPDARDVTAQAEFGRILQLVETIAPEVVGVITNMTVGDVNWGKADTKKDVMLRKLNLNMTARTLTQRLLVSGFAAAWSYDNLDRTRVLEPLGGYLMPLTDEWSTSRVTGIFQTAISADARKQNIWRTRIYDLETDNNGICEMREWRNLKNPAEIGRPPDDEARVFTPAYAMTMLGHDGLTRGAIMQAAPFILNEAVMQVYLSRVTRRAGYPLTVLKGAYDKSSNVGPGGVIIFQDPTGSVDRVPPGDLTQLQTEHDRTIERLKRVLSLPGNFRSAGQAPSGEAIREANLTAFQNCSSLADLVTSIIQKPVNDFLGETQTSATQITVTPNRETMRTETINNILESRKIGVIPLDVAAREIQPFFETWEDDKLEAWILEQTQPQPPEIPVIPNG
jgi:hypothetical protein